ncbi:MAG: LuxR C-terminal-related transcriptional regulator [Anaerolineaceae bacterium]
MSKPLVLTKFFIPLPRANAVVRPRLTEKLVAVLNQPGSFALLSSPAGFGKTSLLSEFVAGLRWPVAWVSLDEGDNDLIRFWTYLITACQTFLEHVGVSVLELLRTPQPLPDDTIATILINDISTQDRSVIIVLDDYHEIQNSSIHASLLFLIEHLPHNLHIIVSTRTDPPWPLALFRARNQLIEIRAMDLRFTTEEATSFLNQVMGLNLSADDVATLEERTEGWVAALQLAALSMIGQRDVVGFIKAFTGSHVYIAEYLVDEVLTRQPEDVQAFMLQTSILERLNAGLCEAVTGGENGQSVLMALHRANLFVIPLDNEGQWFRYHNLFANLLKMRLRQSLPADAIASLHIRAADWYEHYGFDTEAVDHALAAKDFERVASLVEQVAQTMMSSGQFNILKNWLEVLPNESFHTHPSLGIYDFLIDLSLGKLDMSEQTLQEKEIMIRTLPPSPENDRLQVEAMVSLCLFLAHQNTSRAIQIAQETLGKLPEGDLKLRISLFSALYRAYGMDGNIEKSEPAYLECIRLALVAGQYSVASNTTMVRAFDLCQYGRLHEAARYCQSIFEAGTRFEQKVFYPAGPAYIGLAGIYLEWNDLEKAEENLSRGIELCRQGGMDGLYTGYTLKARLHQAKGDFGGALEELSLLEQAFQRREFTLIARQVSIRLVMGDVASASLWVPPLMAMLGDGPDASRLPLIAVEALKLILVRIYIAQGMNERANQVLDEIQATVEPGKRFGRLMEVHLLRALSLHKQNAGNISPAAMECLERALDLAEPAGFVLLFLEEGQALVPLLNAVVDQRAAASRLKKFSRKLLNAFAEIGKPDPSLPPGEVTGLVEPLTLRELEVLQLISAGDSNQMIADKLVISVRTVKKHTSNIYGKLSASSRTQAVARARELGLLTTH